MPKGEKNRKLSDAARDLAVEMYTTPYSDGTWCGVTTIARYFGVANGTIQYLLRIRNIPTRSAKESHSGGKACRPIKNLPKGAPSPCKCGCGLLPVWNRRKNRWNLYVEQHYTMAGPLSPTWSGGGGVYGSAWVAIARTIRERDNHTCGDCGVRRTYPAHSVHHLDRNPGNSVPENLLTLCQGCHARRHVLGV
jgi:5-methylcytosine-specific restriction endonuclease McrA